VARLLQQYPLELPRGMQTTGAASGIFGMHPRYRGSYYYGYGAAASWHWHESMMEQALVRLQTGGVVPRPLVTAGTAATVVPRTFYGVAREAPNVELGVTKATSIHSLHVVMGRW
jgi:predicted alpha/beta hydrolase